MKILVVDLDNEVRPDILNAVKSYLEAFDLDVETIDVQGSSEINISDDYEHIFMCSRVNPINIFPLPKLKKVIYVTQINENISFIDVISSQIEEMYLQDDIIEFLNPSFETQLDVIEKAIIELRNHKDIETNFNIKKLINDIVLSMNKIKASWKK